jgi:hypothetical protein
MQNWRPSQPNPIKRFRNSAPPIRYALATLSAKSSLRIRSVDSEHILKGVSKLGNLQGYLDIIPEKQYLILYSFGLLKCASNPFSKGP